MCTAVKYRWMRDNWPDSSRGVRWLNVAEWVARGLGAEERSEPSLASRTGWFDIGPRKLWEAALEWSQAPPDLLPPPAPAGAAAGLVGAALPEARGATITIAGHDHLCASIGAGATERGDIFDSCGTAESFVRALEPPLGPAEILRANRGRVSIGCHVRPGRLAAMGGFESGLALQRILDLLGNGRRRDRLDEGALALAPGAGGVEIQGVADDEIAIMGIGREVTPAHVWRAALEAVQRRGVEILETLESFGGPRRRLVATGGGLQNDAVRRVKRETLGEFVEPAVKEAGARGAALLAGIAAGLYPDITSLPETRWREPVEP
jgi:sugar (pentulose or hexulose) kinase